MTSRLIGPRFRDPPVLGEPWPERFRMEPGPHEHDRSVQPCVSMCFIPNGNCQSITLTVEEKCSASVPDSQTAKAAPADKALSPSRRRLEALLKERTHGSLRFSRRRKQQRPSGEETWSRPSKTVEDNICGEGEESEGRADVRPERCWTSLRTKSLR